MLSVIIPTLNEAKTLPRTIAHTQAAARGESVEIIVSDCHSHDGTLEVARGLGVEAINGSTCRAEALNHGAARSTGDVLLFLHADSMLPGGYPRLIRHALKRRQIVGGAFDFRFDHHPLRHGLPRQLLKVVMIVNRIRFRWTGNYYGDQGLFVRREIFQQLGGFERVPLMEDLRFSRRLNAAGRTAILNAPIKTSPRRFLTRGVMQVFCHDLAMLGCEALGVRPQKLWQRYNGWNEGKVGNRLRVQESNNA